MKIYTEQEEKVYLEELKNILAIHKNYYTKYINNDMLDFINYKTPLLQDNFYKLTTKISWILHNRTEFPVCKFCNTSEKFKLKNLASTVDYQPCCCGSCAQKIVAKQYINQFATDNTKEKLKRIFEQKYGMGHINPGQYINRKLGYENYLTNPYFRPLFSFEEYDKMCQEKDRYHNYDLKWKCLICNAEFQANVCTKAIKFNGIKIAVHCPHCFPYKGGSRFETEIIKFIKDNYSFKVEQHNRSILLKELCESWKRNHEIDMWIPDLNYAIEFNGTYYHADSRFYKETDLICSKTAKEVWKYDKEKEDILNKLGINYRIIKQYDFEINKQFQFELIKNDIDNLQSKILL